MSLTKLSGTHRREVSGMRKKNGPGSVYVAMPLYVSLGGIRFEIRHNVTQIDSHFTMMGCSALPDISG